MPERINKLQPDRTVYLRGFDTFAAAASIHSASPAGFTVSGTFRDPADFAVAVLYDADNFYEHPLIKYLPDFNLAGLTLTFDLQYTDGLQPIDSPKYNWIDWATLDCIRADGSTAQVRLWDNSMLAGASFPAAAATATVLTTSAGIQPYDRVTLWFQNLAFDYIVPAGQASAEFQFFAEGTGAVHSLTINGVTFSHTEADEGGESSAFVATALIAAIDSPYVTAAPGSASNAVLLTVQTGEAGITFIVTATDGNASVTMLLTTPAVVAANLASQINSTNWVAAGATYALLASANGAAIAITAASYGTVDVNGTAVAWVSGSVFTGILPGATMIIAGAGYLVASIQSPTQLTLSAAAPSATAGIYTAPRGGRDGNLIQLYVTNGTSTLTLDQTQIPLTGGSSFVTWTCTLDFTALGIDQLRQCWLTFAPSLTNGPYIATEWQAIFSNWALAGPAATQALSVAGPGSVRIEETAMCASIGLWSVEAGFYSKYFANATSDMTASVAITYTSRFTHDLYIGTSLYIDRATVGVSLDGDSVTSLNCYLNTSTAVVTRRVVRTSVAAGQHTLVVTMQQAGVFYLDFIEAAVPSDVPDALTPRTNISPALDFDTNHSYQLSPARIMWIMDQLGYAGPMNEYLGVFWWNERVLSGGSLSTVQITFDGPFATGDAIFLTLNRTVLGKSVLDSAVDTPQVIAQHFADYLNGAFVGTWAVASGSILTITGRSPAPAYTVTLSLSTTSTSGTLTQAAIATGEYGNWIVNDSISPPINRAARDWHADFYQQCAARGREVVTSCSMELVNPPAGYVAQFPDASAVSTATGFGDLLSNQCAVGSSKMLAYQKAVYRSIAQMQSGRGPHALHPIWRISLVVLRRCGRHGLLRPGNRRRRRSRAGASPAALPHPQRRSHRERRRRRAIPARPPARLRRGPRCRHPLRVLHRDLRSPLALRCQLPIDESTQPGRKSACRMAAQALQWTRSRESGSAELRFVAEKSEPGPPNRSIIPRLRLAARFSEISRPGFRIGHTLGARTRHCARRRPRRQQPLGFRSRLPLQPFRAGAAARAPVRRN